MRSSYFLSLALFVILSFSGQAHAGKIIIDKVTIKPTRVIHLNPPPAPPAPQPVAPNPTIIQVIVPSVGPTSQMVPVESGLEVQIFVLKDTTTGGLALYSDPHSSISDLNSFNENYSA